jgi:hypothetical protein
LITRLLDYRTCWFSRPVSLSGAIGASDQTALACDLYGAVTEHLDRVPAFTGPIYKMVQAVLLEPPASARCLPRPTVVRNSQGGQRASVPTTSHTDRLVGTAQERLLAALQSPKFNLPFTKLKLPAS